MFCPKLIICNVIFLNIRGNLCNVSLLFQYRTIISYRGRSTVPWGGGAVAPRLSDSVLIQFDPCKIFFLNALSALWLAFALHSDSCSGLSASEPYVLRPQFSNSPLVLRSPLSKLDSRERSNHEWGGRQLPPEF
jgi:hypothetical protein